MPNIASAKKNMRKSRAATVRNRAQRSALRTALKKAKAPDATAEAKLDGDQAARSRGAQGPDPSEQRRPQQEPTRAKPSRVDRRQLEIKRATAFVAVALVSCVTSLS